MGNPKEITQRKVIDESRFRYIEAGKIQASITDNLKYSIDVVIAEIDATGVDLIAGVILSRSWKGNPQAFQSLSWTFYGTSTEITPQNFDIKSEFLFDNEGRDYGHILSVLSILALKVKYDYLRDQTDGFLSEQEIRLFRKLGLWRNYDCNFGKIISGLVRSCKARNDRRRKKDNRHYKHTPLIDRFLFDANEIYNLICWNSYPNDEKDRRAGEKKLWTINADASDIRIIFQSNNYKIGNSLFVLPDNLSVDFLKEHFFPEELFLEKNLRPSQISRITTLTRLGKKKLSIETTGPRQVLKKPNVTEYFDKLKLLPSSLLVGQINNPPSEPQVNWDSIRSKFSHIIDADQKDKDEQGSKMRLDQEVVQLRRNVQRRVSDGSISTFVRQYYTPKDHDIENYWYHFTIGDTEMKTSALVKKEWLGKPSPIGNNDISSEFIEKSLPDISLPLNTATFLINDLTRSGARLWNGTSYRLCEFDHKKGKIHWSFSELEFCRYRFTYGLFYDELIHALWKYNFQIDQILKVSDKGLPLRQRLMPDTHSIFSFSDRICASAVEVFFAIANPSPKNDFTIVTNVRSAEVCEAPHMRHVIPAGFHEPSCIIENETNPLCSLFRELYEELFKGEEVEQTVKRISWDFFFQIPGPMKWLHEHPSSWQLEYLGLNMSPTTGVACLAYLFIVHDPQFSAEFGHELVARWETKSLDIISSMHKTVVTAQLKATNWVAEGLFVYAEGLRRLKQLHPNRCNYPDLNRTSPS